MKTSEFGRFTRRHTGGERQGRLGCCWTPVTTCSNATPQATRHGRFLRGFSPCAVIASLRFLFHSGFTEAAFPHHANDSFKVYNSVVFSIYTELHNHHYE